MNESVELAPDAGNEARLAARYGQRAAQFEVDVPENKPIVELPIRLD